MYTVISTKLRYTVKSSSHNATHRDTAQLRFPGKLKWGNMGYIMNEKGFCIIILDVTNRLQATDYIIIVKIGDCERKKHLD